MSANPRILVTGASGFIGRALVRQLVARSYATLAATRGEAIATPEGALPIAHAVIGGDFDWTAALAGCDAVVHSAARVHVMQDRATDPLAEFRGVNVEGTLQLARAAVAAGVKRFVFISSVKVNGESSPPGSPLQADDAANPVDPYGISKFEAENGLRALASETAMDVVIVRPTLVYGPGVKGNFHSLMRLLHNRAPLPLASIRNHRSLLALDNLLDLIVKCLSDPQAANQTFFASDGEDLSTPQLLRRLAQALGTSALLFPMPPLALQVGAAVLGKRDMAQRLCGSLQVDLRKTRELLGWSPVVTVDEGLRRAAAAFLESMRRESLSG